MAGYYPMGSYYTAVTTNAIANNLYGGISQGMVQASYNTATTTVVWQQWNQDYQRIYEQATGTLQPVDDLPAQLSPEVVAEHEARLRREHEEAERARTLAGARARSLLMECLSPEQRLTFENSGWFEVVTAAGHRYRLLYSPRGQYRMNRHGVYVLSYCIHTYGVPREDELLGFKLMLEANEALFLSTANATQVNAMEAAA